MNKLLIHHQNTILVEHQYFAKEEQFFFDVDSDISDVDFYIGEKLLQGDLRTKIDNCDLLFIKVALSTNYLEYSGIRLAYHIRLTKALGNKTYLPIVLIAEESYQFLGLTYELPQILFSNGIYLMKDNPDALNKYIGLYETSKVKPLNDFDYFLSRLKILPPSNYQSHHSIANEWSLLRWSEILKVKPTEALFTVKQNVEDLLYYKYLLIKNPLENEQPFNFKVYQNIGKVLYIDDEWDKGWNIVINHLLQKIARNFQYSTLEYSFKDSEQSEILTACKEAIDKLDPDIVILDLRLCDDDFYIDNATDKLSGYQVLKYIKNRNPGIQVIIFTASNKVWNLIELQSAEADAFVLKDSPETYNGNVAISQSINTFVNSIRIAADRKFLKNLYSQCSHIQANLAMASADNNAEYDNFIAILKSKIKICQSTLKSISLNKKSTVDVAFLSFYNFLETFTQHYINYDHREYAYYMGVERKDFYNYSYNNGELRNKGKFTKEKNIEPSWSISLKALFIDYFQISSPPHKDISQLEKIQVQRNQFIHSTKENFEIGELISIVNLCKMACSKLID